MRMLELLLVPTTLFIVFVAPVWVVMHYRSMKGSSRGLPPQDLETVEQMLETVDQLSERIEALESILEHDHPHWRKHNQAHNESNTESTS
jgi:phage shock protein B